MLSVLRTSGIFSGISEEETEKMLHCLEVRPETFQKDEYILREGDRVEAFGLVITGKVMIIQEDFWGNRNILAAVGEGQCFAETFACSPGAVLNVSVMAQTNVQVLFLNVKRILTTCPSTCSHHSRMIRNLLSELAEKNLRLNEKITHLGSEAAGQRFYPTFLQKHNAMAVRNLTSHFHASSWQIICLWIGADFPWN